MSSPRRILVVDDDPDVLKVLKRFLKAHGYQVETAADGETALETLRGEPPDLLILDLELPSMSGLELLRSIKEEDVKVDVITVSGHPASAAHLGPDSLKLGAIDFIEKPIDLGYLENLIAKLQARP